MAVTDSMFERTNMFGVVFTFRSKYKDATERNLLALSMVHETVSTLADC